MITRLKEKAVAQKAQTEAQYYGLDLMKMVMAIFVVIIHRPPFPPGLLSFFSKEIFASLAVPFFFAASGFLLFRKIDSHREKANSIFLRYIGRLGILYVFWTLMYMPATLYYFDFEKYGVIRLILIYIKRSILDASFIHLWYLLALIVAVILVFLLSRVIGYKSILMIGIIIYMIYLLIIEFKNITKTIPIFQLFIDAVDLFPVRAVINGLFIGFVFTAIGAFVGTQNIEIKKTVKIPLALFIIFLLFATEALIRLYLWGHHENYSVSLLHLPATFMLLILAIQAKLRQRNIYKTVRKLSSLVYFSHLLINIEWCIIIFENTALERLSKIPAFVFVFTLLYTFTFSFAVIWLEKHKPLRWMKMLY